jgi:hypothetical protein
VGDAAYLLKWIKNPPFAGLLLDVSAYVDYALSIDQREQRTQELSEAAPHG